MRVPLSGVLAALLVLLPSAGALAAIHITDLQGHEVTVYRGPAPVAARTRTVSANSLRKVGSSIITVNAGPDIDAANNDYRRIQNALNAATSGDTIVLNGTFDFTQPFAAAAWALGNDNTAATADDYEVLIPPGLNNVTLTATSLGSATIQGPGDLAAVNLEAFLIFDASLSGASQGWTISNLRILDFDFSIGMFAVATTDYNNTTITNNFIRIPTDLNATVAPADVNQNIGINFSFGTNQSITGNTFQIPGDGVSDTGAGNFSTSVVMQSNTSGGNVYDGLNISNNVIHILNAQSANPQVTLGIWENGHAHTSNITISNNSFINDAAGNSPSLNIERAFRITSHSGASSTVTYDSNQANGANIGFQWISGADFTGNQAVVMTNNLISNCDTGVLVESNGVAHFEDDVITGSGAGGGIQLLTGTLTGSGANTNGIFQTVVSGGSADGVWITATAGAVAPMSQNDLSGNTGFGLRNDAAPQVVAQTNWWGSNLAANVAAEATGNVNFDPWLASGTDVSPGTTGFQPFIYATTSGALTTFVGTAAADTGSALAGNPVTLAMDGETATIPSAELLNLAIQLGASDDVFTLGQLGIPTTFDGGTGNDTLIGTNVAQTWNITGAGSGNIPSAATSFTNVEALRGGSGADSFVFGAAGSIALTVDGGLGIDTLDNTAIPGHTVTPTGPGTLDGLQGTATGVGTTFDNINLIAGNADLSITKTAGPPPYVTSGTVTYTIVVTNGGPGSATNVVTTDVLPAGVTFVSATPTQGSCNGTSTVTCNLGTLANGATATISLQVTLSSTPGPVSNTATVSGSTTDPNPANNSSTSTITTVPAANLPAASPMLLLLLAMALGTLGIFTQRLR